MDLNGSLQDSVATSMTMKLFATRQDALLAHTEATLIELPLSVFTEVDNFDPSRLQNSVNLAYPHQDSHYDRGSVEYHQQQIRQQNSPPIWILQKNNRYILLDGVHRIVASYLENVPVKTFIIKMYSGEACTLTASDNTPVVP